MKVGFSLICIIKKGCTSTVFIIFGCRCIIQGTSICWQECRRDRPGMLALQTSGTSSFSLFEATLSLLIVSRFGMLPTEMILFIQWWLMIWIASPAAAQSGRNLDQFNYRKTIGNDFGPANWDEVMCPDESSCVSSTACDVKMNYIF